MMKTRDDYLEEVARRMHSEDIIGSINKTNESAVKRLTRENAEMTQLIEKKDRMITHKDEMLQQVRQEKSELQQENARLMQQIAELKAKD